MDFRWIFELQAKRTCSPQQVVQPRPSLGTRSLRLCKLWNIHFWSTKLFEQIALMCPMPTKSGNTEKSPRSTVHCTSTDLLWSRPPKSTETAQPTCHRPYSTCQEAWSLRHAEATVGKSQSPRRRPDCHMPRPNRPAPLDTSGSHRNHMAWRV